jgi:hypothetical protein
MQAIDRHAFSNRARHSRPALFCCRASRRNGVCRPYGLGWLRRGYNQANSARPQYPGVRNRMCAILAFGTGHLANGLPLCGSWTAILVARRRAPSSPIGLPANCRRIAVGGRAANSALRPGGEPPRPRSVRHPAVLGVARAGRNYWTDVRNNGRWRRHLPCAPRPVTEVGDHTPNRRHIRRIQPRELSGGPRRGLGNPAAVAHAIAGLVGLRRTRGIFRLMDGRVAYQPASVAAVVGFSAAYGRRPNDRGRFLGEPRGILEFVRGEFAWIDWPIRYWPIIDW